MSRDVVGRRHHRRRLLVYRPSHIDLQSTPTFLEEVTPDTEPSVQSSASRHNGNALQHNPCLTTTPFRGQVKVHQREPLLRTKCYTDGEGIAHHGPPLQTPFSRDHKEMAHHGPPLQTPYSRDHKEMAHHGPPLQILSSRDYKEMAHHGPPSQTPSSRDHKEIAHHGSPLQTLSSPDHKEMAHHGPPLQTLSSRDYKEIAHHGPPLQTLSSPDHKEMAHHGSPLQTLSYRDHKEIAHHGPPLQTFFPRDYKEIVHVGTPLQTPSSRPHHETGQHGTQLLSTPSRYCEPRNEHLACLLASPLERRANRILFVELHDCTHQVVRYHSSSPPADRMSVIGDDTLPCGSGPPIPCDVQDCAVLPGSTDLLRNPLPCDPSSHTPPPQSSPAVVHRWGLFPLFQSVRTKLESFADIFFSPKKRNQETQSEQVVEQPRGEDGRVQPSAHAALDPCQPPDTLPQREAEDEQESRPSASNTDMNLQLKIEISSPVPTLCRPPLQRCLSCPLLPHRPRRYSLGATEQHVPVCSCTANMSRKRRHSVGTVEECRKLPLSPISLTCLRKEKHPSALWIDRQPGSALQYVASSPPGRCLDGVREMELGSGGADTAEESNPLSRCKEVKERKVSNIQIRKRVAKQDGNLTPMGLPKRLRLQKDDFSLEEIYTNKNYHTPTEKRKFETIFEEPVMKGDAVILTSQRPLRRMIVFKDSSAPRRRKKRGRGPGRTRRCADNKGNVNFELLLQHKLDQLEAELQQEETLELN